MTIEEATRPTGTAIIRLSELPACLTDLAYRVVRNALHATLPSLAFCRPVYWMDREWRDADGFARPLLKTWSTPCTVVEDRTLPKCPDPVFVWDEPGKSARQTFEEFARRMNTTVSDTTDTPFWCLVGCGVAYAVIAVRSKTQPGSYVYAVYSYDSYAEYVSKLTGE